MRRHLLFLAIVITLVCSLDGAVRAQGTTRLTVLLVDRLSVPEFLQALPQLPNLRRAVSFGALAMMNVRAGDQRPLSAFLELGSSFRASAPDGAGDWLPAGAPPPIKDGEGLGKAAEVYSSLTGRIAPSSGYVLPGFADLETANPDLVQLGLLGGLGNALRAAGITPAVVGNADLPGAPLRGAPLIAMNGQGRLSDGDLSGDTLMRDPTWPLLLHTDYAALWRVTKAQLETHRLVFVEAGDLARLADLPLTAATQVIARSQIAALHGVDDFVGDWEASASAGDHLLIISPNASPEEGDAGHHVTPILIRTAGHNRGGTLESATTHRIGLVSNLDVAPTLLSWFNVQSPSNFAGSPMLGVDGVNAVGLLTKQYPLFAAAHDASPTVLKTYVGLSIALFLIIGAWLFLASLGLMSKPGHGPIVVIRVLLLGVQAVPLVLLFLPLLGPLTPGGASALTTAGALAVALISERTGRDLVSFGRIALVTVAALLVDMARGGALMRFSILGYDAMGGARYYGIGNEYMGALLGSAIIAAALFVEGRASRWRIGSVALMFAVVTFFLANTALGANVGGAISAFLGLAITWQLVRGGRIRLRVFLLLAVGLPVLLMGAAAADLWLHPHEPSHLGRLARLMLAEGGSPLLRIASRKIATNLKLVRWTIWTRVFAVSLAAVVWLVTRPRQSAPGLLTDRPVLRRGIVGAFVTSLVAFAVNDSGIVAAATTMLPATTLLFAGLLPSVGEAESKCA